MISHTSGEKVQGEGIGGGVDKSTAGVCTADAKQLDHTSM